MNHLLDTHTFLWFNNGSKDLNQQIKMILENKLNNLYLSIASLWEISIKLSIGKIDIIGSIEQVLFDVYECNIEVLPIKFEHLIYQSKLPFHHKDPFDRLIISQVIVENIDLISKDRHFDNYFEDERIKRIW